MMRISAQCDFSRHYYHFDLIDAQCVAAALVCSELDCMPPRSAIWPLREKLIDSPRMRAPTPIASPMAIPRITPGTKSRLIDTRLFLLFWMALHALEHRDVPEVYWVPERFICLVTGFALSICQPTEIHWMLEIDRRRHR